MSEALERALVMCIELAQTTEDLRSWWQQHSRHASHLGEPYTARIIAAKDKRKAELSGRTPEAR